MAGIEDEGESYRANRFEADVQCFHLLGLACKKSQNLQEPAATAGDAD